jgi:hypothetical protein
VVSFEVGGFSTFDLQLRSYELLGAVSVTLEPDDPDSRANEDITTEAIPGLVHLSGLIPPGNYKVFERGALNLYELEVRLTDAPPPLDEFEKNDTFETSTRFRLLDAPDNLVHAFFTHPGGAYDLTLHTPEDTDFSHVEQVAKNPLSVAMLRVTRADEPVNVTVFDIDRKPIDHGSGRSNKLVLLRNAISFVQITGARATRYRLTLRLEVDPANLPGPLENEVVIPLPDLGDPPFQVDDGILHIVFHADALAQLGVINLAATDGQPLQVRLLDAQGAVVRSAQRRENSVHESVSLDVAGLAAGTHVLRITPADARRGTTLAPLVVQRLPSFG